MESSGKKVSSQRLGIIDCVLVYPIWYLSCRWVSESRATSTIDPGQTQTTSNNKTFSNPWPFWNELRRPEGSARLAEFYWGPCHEYEVASAQRILEVPSHRPAGLLRVEESCIVLYSQRPVSSVDAILALHYEAFLWDCARVSV